MSNPDRNPVDRKQYALNLTMAAIAGQVGGVTLVIILGALLGGLWLDKLNSTKPLFTILFMVASMPVTLYLMIRIVKGATSRMRPVLKNKQHENLEGGSES